MGPRSSKHLPGRVAPVLVSNRIMTLATVLRRSGGLIYGRELGLSQSEWRIIAIVGDNAPLSLNALAGTIGLDRGQLSRGITGLVNRGVLTRAASERDGREASIDLSAYGRVVYAKLLNLALVRNRELVAGLTASELKTLLKVLERLSTNAEAMLVRAAQKQRAEQCRAARAGRRRGRKE